MSRGQARAVRCVCRARLPAARLRPHAEAFLHVRHRHCEVGGGVDEMVNPHVNLYSAQVAQVKTLPVQQWLQQTACPRSRTSAGVQHRRSIMVIIREPVIAAQSEARARHAPMRWSTEGRHGHSRPTPQAWRTESIRHERSGGGDLTAEEVQGTRTGTTPVRSRYPDWVTVMACPTGQDTEPGREV